MQMAENKLLECVNEEIQCNIKNKEASTTNISTKNSEKRNPWCPSTAFILHIYISLRTAITTEPVPSVTPK